MLRAWDGSRYHGEPLKDFQKTMLLTISPAKALDYESALPFKPRHTQPRFLDRSEALIGVLRDLNPAQIAELMDLSDPLSVLNFTRYAEWHRPFTAKNARPAIYAFNGDVYDGLAARSLDEDDIAWAQERLRILSGLYGVLRPLDLMQAYRLEMGTRLATPAGKDLYAFWGDTITDSLNADMKKSGGEAVLVNLASEEYFRSVKAKQVKTRIVTPVFQDWKGGGYKIISFFAKRARGLMCRYAITQRIEEVEQLKGFDLDGYAFAPEASEADVWIFRRRVG